MVPSSRVTSTPSCSVLKTDSSSARSRARRWTRFWRLAWSSWSSRPSTRSSELFFRAAISDELGLGLLEERQLAVNIPRLREQLAEEAVAMRDAPPEFQHGFAMLLGAIALV